MSVDGSCIEAGSVGRSLGRQVGLALREAGETGVDPGDVGQVMQACVVPTSEIRRSVTRERPPWRTGSRR